MALHQNVGQSGGLAVEIRSRGFDLTPSMRQYTMQHLAAKLLKHAQRIQWVVVRFEDCNGTHGGADKVCRVELSMPRIHPVVIEEIETDLRAAIDLAADRLEIAVERDLERLYIEPRHRDRGRVR
jgi:ribosome-associated translation inhibitor RaiA